MNTPFISWKKLLRSVTRIGSWFFANQHIFKQLTVFFFLDCNVWNFADETAPFVCKKDLDFVLNKLKRIPRSF